MLIKRNFYLKQLFQHRDDGNIKIITGVRRCGKSTLLQLYINELQEQGVAPEQILLFNCEMRKMGLDIHKLHQQISTQIVPARRTYLFFDEIYKIPNWQIVVNSLRTDFACDIYVTSSNSSLFGSEPSTLITSCSVTIPVYPLSFREFLEFKNVRVESTSNPLSKYHYLVYDKSNNQLLDLEQLFHTYLTYGGMPDAVSHLDTDPLVFASDNLCSSLALDVFECNAGTRQINNATLLQHILSQLARNLGQTTTIDRIFHAVHAQPYTTSFLKVDSYVRALQTANLCYEVKRMDLCNKQVLRSHSKYYLSDHSLRTYYLGTPNNNLDAVLKNIIYIELLRRGYYTWVGKLRKLEIDFVAEKHKSPTLYIQVAHALTEPNTFDKILEPLEKVNAHQKFIITLAPTQVDYCGGTKIVNVIDWLLDD